VLVTSLVWAAEPVEWTYLCPDGSLFVAAAGESTATVQALGQTLTLPLTRSASGARYADAHWVFWNKGRTARLERDGKPLFVDCVATPVVEGRLAPAPVDGGMGTDWYTVRGTATYRERIALPPTAQLEVRVSDYSRADAAELTLAEVRLPIEHAVPIPFELRYYAGLIDPRRRYQLRASIFDGDRLLFITDRAYPVITGHPNQVELVLKKVSSTAGSGHSLTGAVWELQRLVEPDTTPLTPEDPSRYTIQFLEGGRVGIRADCNTGSGPYTVDGSKLSFGNAAMSLVACLPGSYDSEFLRALAKVESYRLHGGKLELELKGGGVLDFRRAGGG